MSPRGPIGLRGAGARPREWWPPQLGCPVEPMNESALRSRCRGRNPRRPSRVSTTTQASSKRRPTTRNALPMRSQHTKANRRPSQTEACRMRKVELNDGSCRPNIDLVVLAHQCASTAEGASRTSRPRLCHQAARGETPPDDFREKDRAHTLLRQSSNVVMGSKSVAGEGSAEEMRTIMASDYKCVTRVRAPRSLSQTGSAQRAADSEPAYTIDVIFVIDVTYRDAAGNWRDCAPNAVPGAARRPNRPGAV